MGCVMSRPPRAARPEPLNPVLYNSLVHKFGDVKLANAGVPAVVHEVFDPLRNETVKNATCWGEYYCVNCPFCNDVGNKLWINHQYGATYNEQFHRRNDTHLACCYKNSCLSVAGRYKQLESLIFGIGAPVLKNMPIRHVSGDFNPQPCVPPGTIVSFHDLPDDHIAATYLRSRGFDPKQLSTDYGVGLCTETYSEDERIKIMRQRIYIPVVFNSQLVSWQGRVVGDRKQPKYFNRPDSSKTTLLYNYDAASKQAGVIVVEGVPSVWRLGKSAVCLFGNTLSTWQCNTIATTWANKPVFYVLDRGTEDVIEKGVEALCRHGARVIPLILPDSRDPADYPVSEFKLLLQAAADSVSEQVDFSFMD